MDRVRSRTRAILDRVVDDDGPVVAGIENDIDEIENEVFGTSGIGQGGLNQPREVRLLLLRERASGEGAQSDSRAG